MKHLAILTVCVVLAAAVSGCGAQTASQKCFASPKGKALKGSEECLEIAEHGSAAAAAQSRHVESVKAEAAEIEKVLKERRAEHIADELEGR